MVDGGGRPPPKRMRITYQVRDRTADGGFRGSINALQIDESGKRLFTGGRDAVVREWDVSNESRTEIKPTTTFEGHTDWINGLALCANIGALASVSSDRTIQIWRVNDDTDITSGGTTGGPMGGPILGPQRSQAAKGHTDYVKAVAYAQDEHLLLTAGLDSQVLVWNVSDGPSGEVCVSELRHTDSVYALAVNHRGTVAALGAVNKVVRLWDPRTRNHFGTLQGHLDVVKALAVNADGTRCLSGSSDNTLKLWDVGERRCLATYRPHADSVWCMQASSDFSRVVTGGRDGSVWFTDLRASGASDGRAISTLVAKESSAILALALAHDDTTVWASTVDAGVKQWDMTRLNTKDEDRTSLYCDRDQGSNPRVSGKEAVPSEQGDGARVNAKGVLRKEMMGRPGLTRASMLPDGQRVVTQDKAGCVALWNIVSGQHLMDCPGVDFKTVLKEQSVEPVDAKKWCSLDTSLGHISVHLEHDAFSAWIPAVHLQALGPDQRRVHRDVKVNIGGIVLQAMLRHYQEGVQLASFRTQQPSATSSDESVLVDLHRRCVQQRTSHDWLCLPPDTPVHVSQTNCDPPMCLVRFTVDTAVQNVSVLQTALPDWVHQCLFNTKGVPFGDRGKVGSMKVVLVARGDVAPDEARLPSTSSGELQVDETLLMSQLQTHIHDSLGEKIPPGAGVRPVRLYCGTTPLTADMSVGYVYRKLWKKSKSMQLLYCAVHETKTDA